MRGSNLYTALTAMVVDSVRNAASTKAQQNPPKAPDGKERIYIVNVDVWSYDKNINPDAQVLRGNVIFKHNNGYMYCDSALLYEQQNSFEAFGAVRFEQGDSLRIFCDYLDYNGFTMLARLREHVRMEHGETTLYTDSFDYDRTSGIGYYFDFGTIADTINTLSSIYGEYSTITKQAIFNNDVKLENDNFTMFSDTLHYDTNTKIATILGPTRIVSDSGYILATRGQYDTEHDRAYLMDRARLYSGQRQMTGDSLYYDRLNKVAEMYGHVIMKDTVQQAELRGNYSEYHEDSQYGMAKDSAYLVEYSSKDTLYAHALVMEMIKVDSAENIVKGLGNVRLYREDMQGTCDSLFYYSKDSTILLNGNPFIWSGTSQLKGDSIKIYMKNGNIDWAHITPNAYGASRHDDKHYDQLRGNEMKAYFNDQKLDSVLVIGNAESIYYTVEKDSTLSTHTKTQGSSIKMTFIDEEIYKIKFLEKTIGDINPLSLVEEKDLFFSDFVWFGNGRPSSFQDIFRITPKPSSSSPFGTTPLPDNVEIGESSESNDDQSDTSSIVAPSSTEATSQRRNDTTSATKFDDLLKGVGKQQSTEVEKSKAELDKKSVGKSAVSTAAEDDAAKEKHGSEPVNSSK